jgi:hypothetical protein
MQSNAPNRPEETIETGKKAWTRPVAVTERASAAEAKNFAGGINDGVFSCSS